jgi:hypothetical protein
MKLDRALPWAFVSLCAAAPLGALAWAVRRIQNSSYTPVTSTQISAERPVAVPRMLYWDDEPLQLTADGDGPLYHRRYRADIARPGMSAEALMRAIQRDVNALSPQTHAQFRKRIGHPQRMAVGDRYDITIAGPWNGAVRVVEVGPRSFSFVTVEGHPEAGQIRFRIGKHPGQPDALRFEILSWARSRDALVSLAYEAGGKAIQKDAWVRFCQQVAEISRGELIDKVQVLTEERPFTGEVVRSV